MSVGPPGRRRARAVRATGQVALFLCAVTVGLLAACSESAPPGGLDQPGTSPDASFDSFLGDELGLIEYAVRRVRNECLADAGYPQNLEGMADAPSRAFPYLVISDGTFGPTSVEEARRVGFGRDVPAQPARIVSFDANYDANLDRCEQQAYDALGQEPQSVLNAYNDLGNSLYNEFTAELGEAMDQELPDAAAALLECVASKGYAPVDEAAFIEEPDPASFGVGFGDIEELPGREDQWEPERVQGTVQVGPPVPAVRYVPTPAEAELAVAWFECRRDTGLTERLIQLAEGVEARVAAGYENEFLELNPQIEDLARTARTVVDE